MPKTWKTPQGLSLQEIVACQDTFVSAYLPAIERHARRRHGYRSEFDDLAAEAVALGWQMYLQLTAGRRPIVKGPGMVAVCSVQWAALGHRLGQPHASTDVLSRAYRGRAAGKGQPSGWTTVRLGDRAGRIAQPLTEGSHRRDIRTHPLWRPWKKAFFAGRRDATSRARYTTFLRMAHRGSDLHAIARRLGVTVDVARRMAERIARSWGALRANPEAYLAGTGA
jgi:hypothetical protein